MLVLTPSEFDTDRFSARIIMARPKTLPIFPGDRIIYNAMGEPLLTGFHFLVIPLDDRTAKCSTFKNVFEEWKEQADEEEVVKYFEALLKNWHRFTLTGRGCGMAYYRMQ